MSSARKSAAWLELAVFRNSLEHRISNFATLGDEIRLDDAFLRKLLTAYVYGLSKTLSQKSVLSGQDRIAQCTRSLICQSSPRFEAP